MYISISVLASKFKKNTCQERCSGEQDDGRGTTRQLEPSEDDRSNQSNHFVANRTHRQRSDRAPGAVVVDRLQRNSCFVGGLLKVCVGLERCGGGGSGQTARGVIVLTTQNSTGLKGTHWNFFYHGASDETGGPTQRPTQKQQAAKDCRRKLQLTVRRDRGSN